MTLNVMTKRLAASLGIPQPGSLYPSTFPWLGLLVTALIAIGISGGASAQPGTRSIAFVSVCSDGSVPGTSGSCPTTTVDTKQNVLAHGVPINTYSNNFRYLADEHSTIFPPNYLPNRTCDPSQCGNNGDYLFFVTAGGGLGVLSDFGKGPDSNGQWSLDFAPDFGPNYQTSPEAPGLGAIFIRPMAQNACPTEPSEPDPTFDLNYADPGSVVKDPTNLENNGPGGLIMIYEGTNRCSGDPAGFYATTGVATSNDWGHTWPSYRYLLDAHGNLQYPLPEQNLCSTTPCVGPNEATGAIYDQVCVGDACQSSSTQWPPDQNYGRYLAIGKYHKIQMAVGNGDQAPSAFVDDIGGSSPYLYVTDGPLVVARAPLNGGTGKLSFNYWNQGTFDLSQPAIGGEQTPISFLGPQNQTASCQDPNQHPTMGSFSYVEDTQQYLLTFVCMSSDGDPANPDGSTKGASWFYSTNSDLSHQDHWSTPKEIIGSWRAYSNTTCDFEGWYPSFMSLSQNPGHLMTSGYAFYMQGCTGSKTPHGRRFQTRQFTINWKTAQTFQPIDTQHIYVLGSDGKLWLEHGPFGTVPPPRNQIDASVSTFQALQDGSESVLVLGMDENLWLESPPFDNLPPKRTQVDGSVRAFQGLNSSLIYVLGDNGILWQEQTPFGSFPPARQQVDSNVRAFQAVNDQAILVLGTDGRLWYETGPYGTVPPQQIDANVLAFQIINPGGDVWVLRTDGTLWLEQPPFGTVTPLRTQIDGNVRAFQAFDNSDVFVLGTNGNLWLEHGPFGTVPPPRTQVDAKVRAFQYVDLQHVFVLGLDGDLWSEPAPYGTVPPPNRKQIDDNVM